MTSDKQQRQATAEARAQRGWLKGSDGVMYITYALHTVLREHRLVAFYSMEGFPLMGILMAPLVIRKKEHWEQEKQHGDGARGREGCGTRQEGLPPGTSPRKLQHPPSSFSFGTSWYEQVRETQVSILQIFLFFFFFGWLAYLILILSLIFFFSESLPFWMQKPSFWFVHNYISALALLWTLIWKVALPFGRI